MRPPIAGIQRGPGTAVGGQRATTMRNAWNVQRLDAPTRARLESLFWRGNQFVGW